MAKGYFAVSACFLALACGGADPPDEGKQGPGPTHVEGSYQPPPNANGNDYGNGGPWLPPGWTNWSCPGPGCDPVDELEQIRDAVPDPEDDQLTNPAPGTMPSALPPDAYSRSRQTR